MIGFSRLTRPEPKEKLDAIDALLHTPAGEEFRLREKGIEVMYEGSSKAEEEITDVSLEERGHSLLLVDLLSLRKKFSLKKYRVDLEGFGVALLFVLAIFAVGLLTAAIA
jgi:hypothetical protein